mmetsp:Transcript_7982/g.23446  ORF Transcript_7982/g.23446 Transcript_7982/m.23446 type:complete len:239 (+) Transcript_7982:33-749(+)
MRVDGGANPTMPKNPTQRTLYHGQTATSSSEKRARQNRSHAGTVLSLSVGRLKQVRPLFFTRELAPLLRRHRVVAVGGVGGAERLDEGGGHGTAVAVSGPHLVGGGEGRGEARPGQGVAADELHFERRAVVQQPPVDNVLLAELVEGRREERRLARPLVALLARAPRPAALERAGADHRPLDARGAAHPRDLRLHRLVARHSLRIGGPDVLIGGRLGGRGEEAHALAVQVAAHHGDAL